MMKWIADEPTPYAVSALRRITPYTGFVVIVTLALLFTWRG